MQLNAQNAFNFQYYFCSAVSLQTGRLLWRMGRLLRRNQKVSCEECCFIYACTVPKVFGACLVFHRLLRSSLAFLETCLEVLFVAEMQWGS